MVSIRILMSIGIGYTQQYAQRFGFKPSELPASLSMALGTGETTPLRIAEAYSVLPMVVIKSQLMLSTKSTIAKVV